MTGLVSMDLEQREVGEVSSMISMRPLSGASDSSGSQSQACFCFFVFHLRGANLFFVFLIKHDAADRAPAL